MSGAGNSVNELVGVLGGTPPSDLPESALFLGPFCNNPGCPCGTAGAVCDDFQGLIEGPDPFFGCHRCGWNEAAHG